MREGSKSPAMYQKHMVQALGACAYRSIDEHWPLKTALCYQIKTHCFQVLFKKWYGPCGYQVIFPKVKWWHF